MFDDKLARHDMRIGEYLVQFVDRTGGDELGLEGAEQIEFSERANFLAKGLDERIAISNTVGIFPETKIRREFRCTKHGNKARELGVVSNGDHDMSVARRERLIGHNVGVSIAVTARRLAGCQEVHPLIRESRNLHIEEREIDVLPLAAGPPFVERRENRDRRV